MLCDSIVKKFSILNISNISKLKIQKKRGGKRNLKILFPYLFHSFNIIIVIKNFKYEKNYTIFRNYVYYILNLLISNVSIETSVYIENG